VATLFGEDAVRVVDTLKGVHEITDNEIADKTQIRLNMVRKALYSLYDHSLVAFRQSRTKKPAGSSSTGDSNPTSWKALS
jgi:transcription initiation factor IIE alpha subunit